MNRGLVAAAAAFLLPAAALAQSPSRIVPRERADQARRPPTEPAQPAPQAPAAEAAAVPNFAPFAMQGLVVEGSSLSAGEIEAVGRRFQGQMMDPALAGKVADAVAEAYGRSPIAFYTVLVADAAQGQDGRLRLQAIEGYVAEASLEGDIGGRDMSLVRAYLGKITAEKPLTKRTLQRYVALIRDIPELNPNIQLLPGARLGEVVLQLGVKPRPFRLGVAVNDRGTAFLGRTQAQADINLYSLLVQGDALRLSVAAPTHRVRRFQYYSAGYSTFVGSNGTQLSLNGGYLRTRPDFYDLKGDAKSLGVQLAHPLMRTLQKSVYLTLGVDGLNSDNALFGQALSSDRTRAVRLGGAYNAETPNRYFGASVALSAGLGDVLGGRTLNPQGSELDFVKVNARAVYNTRVGKPFVLRLVGAGQASKDRLPGSEQFALGGDEFGRAYEAALISGDQAIAGSAEFALRPPTGLPPLFAGSEAYVFTDAGQVWYRARFGYPTQKLWLGSAGGGVRVAVSGKAELQLEAARTLANSTPFLDRRDTRVIFAIRTLF